MYRNLRVCLSLANMQCMSKRSMAQIKHPKKDKQLQAYAESLAARGFLRPNKPWSPPSNIEKTVLKICEKNGLKTTSTFESLGVKFTILKTCFEETGYGVPNSLLHTIKNVDNLVDFYMTPVDTTTPFEALKKIDLPKNLYVQKDYVRYNPDDEFYKGKKTVFPKSSTIVSGLTTRKKYVGYAAKRSWP